MCKCGCHCRLFPLCQPLREIRVVCGARRRVNSCHPAFGQRLSLLWRQLLGLSLGLGLGIRVGLGLGLGVRVGLGFRLRLGIRVGFGFSLRLRRGVPRPLRLALCLRSDLGLRLDLSILTTVLFGSSGLQDARLPRHRRLL